MIGGPAFAGSFKPMVQYLNQRSAQTTGQPDDDVRRASPALIGDPVALEGQFPAWIEYHNAPAIAHRSPLEEHFHLYPPAFARIVGNEFLTLARSRLVYAGRQTPPLAHPVKILELLPDS